MHHRLDYWAVAEQEPVRELVQEPAVQVLVQVQPEQEQGGQAEELDLFELLRLSD